MGVALLPGPVLLVDDREQHAQRQELVESARRLRDASRRIEDSEALLDGIVEAAPVGIGFVDRELRYRRVNDALSCLDSRPPAAHAGVRAVDLLPGVPAEELEAAWRRAMGGTIAIRSDAKRTIFSVELPLRCAPGPDAEEHPGAEAGTEFGRGVDPAGRTGYVWY